MKASMCQADTHPTPPPPGFFKGRIQKSKYMDYWKSAEESKADVDDRRNLKQKRVFGTQRNTNVVVNKPKTEKKPAAKLQVETAQKQPNSSAKTSQVENVEDKVSQKDEDVEEGSGVEPQVIETAVGSEEPKTNAKEEQKPVVGTEVKPKKKKSVGFQEQTDEEEASASAPRTPVQLSSSLRKPRRSGTPYHTAHNCRRCRIDKLESSSYWIEQIKLAESVGKHFVSVALFHLAHECNAEPVRSLKMELKRYVLRHGDLGEHNKWAEALRNFGLPVPKDHDDDKSSGEMMHSRNMLKLDDEPNAATCGHEPKTSNTA